MELRAEVAVNAQAEDAWVVVGGRFGEIGRWASAITESVIDGQPGAGRVRTCHVAGFGPIRSGGGQGAAGDLRPRSQVTKLRGGRGFAGFHPPRRQPMVGAPTTTG